MFPSAKLRGVQNRMVRPGVEERRMRTGRKKGVGVGGGLREGWRRREVERGFCNSGLSATPDTILLEAVCSPSAPQKTP